MTASWRARGVTVLEMLIAGGVAFLILVAVETVLTLGSRFHKRVLTTLELQQNCLLGLESIGRELSESHPGTIRFDTSPSALIFASCQTSTGEIQVDTAGSNVWQKWVAFYVDRGNLVRKEMALSSGASPTPPTLTPLVTGSSFLSLSTNQKVVAQWMEDLRGTAASPCNVTLVGYRREIGLDFRLTVETQVRPRN